MSVLLTTARVLPSSIFDKASLLALTTRSPPRMACASPVAMRAAWMSSGRSAMRRCEKTAPYFCASPVMSSVDTPLPSRWAAMPIRAPGVIVPWPPTPVMIRFHGVAVEGSAGAGKIGQFVLSTAGLGFFSVPPSMVTKLGQKPFRHDKSWLHADWLMRRLVPNAVSTGSTDRQLDCTEQSPQPSQTSSLMKAR
ncbi:hypothetical protein SDC9_135954 [bioreactor metagenome]|uniref:Uncharacterized protein n=1 Tax=bioreactor metagenome TaxID=1076179 RepID=A0A645DH93_9ZZZZ